MPKAYSYARWSSQQQGHGDSLRRQLNLSRDYAAKHGLDLDESFRDPAVSAYRGKNRTEGALGNFIKQIGGAVQPGSYLIVESLDRLSREQVLVALELFISIVRRGVKIVTLLDEQEYDAEQLNRNVGLLYRSIGVMERAHEESQTKGRRVADANAQKRKRAREDRVPMTSLCPGWLRLVRRGRRYDDAIFEIIPERTAVVRRIYEEALAGLGKHQITKRLNDEKVPAFRGKHGWHSSSVSRILTDQSVIGYFQPHRKIEGKRVPDGEPIADYFPPIIETAMFWQVQKVIQERRRGAAGRKGQGIRNLFAGLVYCAHCGARLRFVDKGPPPKGGSYLVCADSLRGLCAHKTAFPYEKLERLVCDHTRSALVQSYESRLQTTDSAAAQRLGELETALVHKRNERERLLDAFGDDPDDRQVQDRVRQRGEEIKKLEVELADARREASMEQHFDYDGWLVRFAHAKWMLRSEDPDERLLARASLAQEYRRAIHGMWLSDDRRMTVWLHPDNEKRRFAFVYGVDGPIWMREYRPDGTYTHLGEDGLARFAEINREPPITREWLTLSQAEVQKRSSAELEGEFVTVGLPDGNRWLVPKDRIPRLISTGLIKR